MSYLIRRVKRLLEALESSQLHLMPTEVDEVKRDIATIKYFDNGEIVLDSVSQKLRSLARSFYNVSKFMEQHDRKPEAPSGHRTIPSDKRTRDLMLTLFAHFEECFCSLTGSTPELFTKGQDFNTALMALRHSFQGDSALMTQRHQAFERAMQGLEAFYATARSELWAASKAAVGLKYVLGGKQAFLSDSLDATRSMLLYGDTIAIPDPIYRWIETRRLGRDISPPRVLEDLNWLLKLKPLVDAPLSIPPILVFPSFEKSLEAMDEATQDGQEQLIMRFFRHYLGAHFDAASEIFSYARTRPEMLLEVLRENRLLVGYGVAIDQGLAEHIAAIRENHRLYRAHDGTGKLSDSELAVLTIMERLGPLYHLNENAEEMNASPLMSLEVHWHYYRLLGQAEGRILAENGEIPVGTVTMTSALVSPEHKWLGNVPINVLTELRMRGENVEFRKRLHAQLNALSSASASEVAKTSALVGRALEMLLIEHSRDVKKICDKYEAIYAPQLVVPWVTIAAWLFPFIPALPIPISAPITMYIGTKIAETVEKYRMGRTLTGALAASAHQRNQK